MYKWLIAGVLVTIIVTVRCQDPEIVDEIWPEVKPVGRTARLNCTVVNKQNNVVLWIHVNTSQTISKDDTIDLDNEIVGGLRKYEVKIRPSENRITFMLIVRRLREQNAGYYKCLVRIQGREPKEWPSKVGILTVQVQPAIRPGETTTVLIVDQNDNSQLLCKATGIPHPNITWVRSDGGWLPTGAAQSRGEVLQLKNVTVKMGGVYRCVADNNIRPPAQHLAQVLVFDAPTVRVVQDSVGQAQNRRFHAKLECIVQGYPSPSVRWERVVNNGRAQINDDDKFDFNKQTTDNQNLMSGEQWYTLKVKNVQANDYTTYFCIATNSKGTNMATITLFETTECQGPNCPSLPSSDTVYIKSSLLVLVASSLLHITSLYFFHR
ncbi:lachesin-like [Gigantopelta aegis]|uniref:lachesin-like n=1 Tax=Gigantopelta aegis TaxID=1735272 RepID=UPI001B88A50D|nr:lachesin-like [Gigantopelta aegis]